MEPTAKLTCLGQPAQYGPLTLNGLIAVVRYLRLFEQLGKELDTQSEVGVALALLEGFPDAMESISGVSAVIWGSARPEEAIREARAYLAWRLKDSPLAAQIDALRAELEPMAADLSYIVETFR